MSPAPCVDFAAPGEAARFEPQWRALAARAEPNVFASPDFLIPAFAHLAPGGLVLALVWADDSRAKLVAMAAIIPARTRFTLAAVWMHKLAALPALLVDPDAAPAALAAWRAALKQRGIGAGLLIPNLATASALWAALEAAPHAITARTQRAMLACSPAADFAAALPAKRRKEWGRQRRRLGEGAALTSGVTEGVAALADFFALEAAGWKGARGTALADAPGQRAFTMAMAQRLALQGAFAVHWLRRGEAMVAAGIVLRSGARAFYWKTAFDERHAALSPGVQLTLELSKRLERDPALECADSCAMADHPMIDRLWPGRIELADVAVAFGTGTSLGFQVGRAAHRWRGVLTARIKRLLPS